MKRFLTVALSVVLFATLFSWISYVPVSQREPNVYYFGFFETFIFVIIYAGPLYILVGLPLSILIDKVIGRYNRKSKLARYFIGLGLYSLAGILVGLAFVAIGDPNPHQLEVISFLIYGFAASNFYFHLSLLISILVKN